MKRRSIIWLCIAGLLLAAVIGFFLSTTSSDIDAEADEAERKLAGGSRPDAPAPGHAPDLTHRDDAAPLPAFDPDEGPQRIDLETRAQLIKAIADALDRRKAAAPSSPPTAAAGTEDGGEPQERGSLDKEYLRERIREIAPLAIECYEMALEEQPQLEGTVHVKFDILGDEELGGVVSESEIVKQTLSEGSPGLTECIQESMYAIRIKSPEGGGKVTVIYPFKFRQREESN